MAAHLKETASRISGKIWMQLKQLLWAGLSFLSARKKTIVLLLSILLWFALSLTWVFELTPILASYVPTARKTTHELTEEQQKQLKLEIQNSSKAIKQSQYLLERSTPRTGYLVINTNENHFYLHRGSKIVRDGMCSTGSYTLLQGGENQQWVFKTPKGLFRIQGKKEDPVWKKPDWAFVEEGLPIPSQNHPSRFEYGVLGDYALALGDGYLIHGTLYKRFLGLPVTHGCIRLNDDDLYAVYNSLEPGSKVYIF